MRLLALHDAKGNLAAVVSQPANMPGGTVAPMAGQLVTEVEPVGVTIDPADANSLLKLVEIVEHYRIEVNTEAKLASKQSEVP